MTGVRRKDKGREDAVEAAATVFREYGRFIHAVLRFQAADRFDLDDLFQEFFLTLVHKPMPPDVRNIRSFLYRAIFNYVLDLVRKQATYGRNLEKYAEAARICINNRPSENAFLEEEGKAAVSCLVRYLQQREAQAFVLKYRDNYSIAEIAATMGVNKRTVSRYLSEGLKKLRKTLAIE